MKKKNKSEKISPFLVFLLVLLMGSFVYVQIRVFDFFEMKSGTFNSKVSDDLEWGMVEDIKAAKGMYETLRSPHNPPDFVDPSAKQRTLEYFYSLRAYDGAPPIIPHPILRSKSLTGDSCIGCHLDGGYTPKWNAYAPVVPHPEKMNCRQCHNPRNSEVLFKKTGWHKQAAKRGVAHLPGSPLVIPHTIQMRENCLSCHSGPGAVAEIRTTHPERVNCMQCHVEKKSMNTWEQK